MDQKTDLEQQLAEILVEVLDLEDIDPGSIAPEGLLFGVDAPGSLGLDSIDALEIALAIDQHFGVQLTAEDENNKAIFASIRSLCEYIEGQR